MRKRPLLLAFSATLSMLTLMAQTSVAAAPAGPPSSTSKPSCINQRLLCKEVLNSEQVFGEGHYVGHDEPTVNFYSNRPGSGSDVTWRMRLPKDPPSSPTAGRSYNFQLHPAFWFGMAMCATQSYPLQVDTCAPGSDTNVQPLAQHPGAAYLEVQFYPPGWAPLPAGTSCGADKWCAALAQWSVAENPVRGLKLNDTCAGLVGIEYGNIAFIQVDGIPTGPPNPVHATLATFTPNAQTLLMSSGDVVKTHMHDTEHGLRIDVFDQTTNTSGFMVMSAANGFGQVKFAPNPSTECTNLPYDFHPMYSTSTAQSRTPWAAASGNIEWTDETGHFDLCSQVGATSGSCTGTESKGEPADLDDNFCFSAPPAPLVSIAGCLDTNVGFDGTAYQKNYWPDGSPNHPEPVQFTTPSTDGHQFTGAGFETDLPAIEQPHPGSGSNCNTLTGQGCTLFPTTDDGTRAPFYPFFSIHQGGAGCYWMFGSDISGLSTQNFERNQQYGDLLYQDFLVFGGGGATQSQTRTFRQILAQNPCGNDQSGGGGGDQVAFGPQ